MPKWKIKCIIGKNYYFKIIAHHLDTGCFQFLSSIATIKEFNQKPRSTSWMSDWRDPLHAHSVTIPRSPSDWYIPREGNRCSDRMRRVLAMSWSSNLKSLQTDNRDLETVFNKVHFRDRFRVMLFLCHLEKEGFPLSSLSAV